MPVKKCHNVLENKYFQTIILKNFDFQVVVAGFFHNHLIQDFQEYFYHPPTAPPSNPAPFNHQWNRVTILIMNLNSLFNFYTDKKL